MSALQGYIARTRGARFAWGVNDCALWCAGAVEACTGVDPAADLRGQYESRWESRRIEMQAGGLLRLVTDRMNALDVLRPFDGTSAPEGVAICTHGALRLCCVIASGHAFMRTARGLRVAGLHEVSFLGGWTWHKLSR